MPELKQVNTSVGNTLGFGSAGFALFRLEAGADGAGSLGLGLRAGQAAASMAAGGVAWGRNRMADVTRTLCWVEAIAIRLEAKKLLATRSH